jgi:hypothetical protein
MPQSVTAVWSNLYTACQGLFPAPTLVSFGDPGAYQPDVIVAVMGGKIPVARPTMGTNRSREKTCDVEVMISVYIPGDNQQSQVAAWTAAQAMSDQLEAYFRTAGNETLSGACREAYVSDTVVDLSNIRDADSGNQSGSIAEITATVTAYVRI